MTLTHVFTVSRCIELALFCLAQVLRCELVLVASLVVNFGSAEVIMRLSVHHDSVLLGHHLIFVYL